MSLELINAIAGIGTLVLLAATVTAGVIQLRHMRAGNELAALLAIERDFRSAEVQDALRYVQEELPRRLERADYRAELGRPGYIDARRHPEMILCNWFNRTGALVRAGFIHEELFLDSFGRLVTYYWKLLVPLVAVLRRTRGPAQYAGFEYLAARAAARGNDPNASRYPKGAARLAVTDAWPDGDERR